MWGWCRAPVSRDFGHQVTCVDKDADKIATPAPRRNPDFRARPRCAGGLQCEGRAAGFHHRSGGAGRRGRCGVHRGRHAVAARRRPCRSDLCPYRRARDRRRARGLHRGRHQIDRAGRHRRRSRAADPRSQSVGRRGGGLQSGIPARGCRDPRLQVSRPHRGRHRRTSARARCSAISTGRCRSTRRR